MSTRRQQELEGALVRLAEATSSRDSALASTTEQLRQHTAEIRFRKNSQADLARQVAQKEAELAAMRVQVNNHRLGTVVARFGGPGGGAGAAKESFEPAFAYHDLMQRANALACKKALVARELEAQISSRSKSAKHGAVAAAGDAENMHAPTASTSPPPTHPPCMATVDILRSTLRVIKKQEDAMAAEKAALHLERARHIRAVKLRQETSISAYQHSAVLSDFVLMSMFGKGGFAEVFKAYDVHNAREVALKIHSVDRGAGGGHRGACAEYVRRAIREVKILQGLRHSSIVRMHQVLQISDTSFAIVMEACNGGDLQTYLAERPDKQLPEREAAPIIAQVLDGLAYLNSEHDLRDSETETSRKRIIHYDLKPANILFDDLGMVKISDFGLSKLLSVDAADSCMELTTPGAGTLFYQPPENFLVAAGGGRPMIDNKVDVWAVGVIFYEMLYGRRPFHGAASQSSIAGGAHLLLAAHELRFDAKPPVSPAAKAFIGQCLTYHREQRPGVDAAVAAFRTYLAEAAPARARPAP